MIHIIGLGPGSEKHLTLEIIDLLKDESKELFLRTEIHPTIEYLKSEKINYQSFDHLYENAEAFEDIYSEIVNQLVKISKTKEIIYAVPGNPVVAEKSVFILLEKAKENNVETKLYPSLSSLEVIYSAVNIDPLDGLIIMNADNLNPLRLDKNISTLLVQVYAQHIASELKLSLMEVYPDTYPVILIKSAGIPNEERIEEIPLYQLDRVDWIDHLTSLFIKPNQFPLTDEEVGISGNSSIDRLVNIVSYLRSPDGCPWDRKQTPMSVRKHIVEEAYEVVEAIESKDNDKIMDELGDLLLQVVLQSEIFSNDNVFDFQDVAQTIGDKLVRRHPHVFGDKEVADNPDEVKNLWEKLKNKEKKDSDSYLDGIPRALPSLLRAEKFQRKASSVGFDWEMIGGVIDKVKEEIDELKEAVNNDNKLEIEEELGDLLFSVVNLSRWKKIDPEEALNKAINKFSKRFRQVESTIKQQDKKFSDFSIDQLEEFWQKAKKG